MEFKITNLEHSNPDATVYVVHYKVNSDFTGKIRFVPQPKAEGFIPFTDLTEETVIGWVKEKIDNRIKENGNPIGLQSLEDQLNATTNQMDQGMPWLVK